MVKLKYLYKWHINHNDLYDCPSDIAINKDGDVYVTLSENNHVIHIYNKSGELKKVIGDSFVNEEKMSHPSGIDLDINGNIYVVDSGNNRIVVFDTNGKIVNMWGEEGHQIGEFYYPSGIKVSIQGEIYVTDTLNHRIQIFNSNGEFIYNFGEEGSLPGQMISPSGIVLHDDGKIYISEIGNRRIQKFTNKGISESIYSLHDLKYYKWCRPTGMCIVDSDIFVMDSNKNSIYIYSDNQCKSIITDLFDEDQNELYNPNGIAIDDNGILYIADSANYCVKVFAIE